MPRGYAKIVIPAVLLTGMLTALPCNASERSAGPAQSKQQTANEQALAGGEAAAAARSPVTVAFAETSEQTAPPGRKGETRLAAERDDEDEDEPGIRKPTLSGTSSPARTAQPSRKLETGPAADRDADEDEDDAATKMPTAAPRGGKSPALTDRPPRKVETKPGADRDEDDDEEHAVSKAPNAAPRGAKSSVPTAPPSGKVEPRPAADRSDDDEDEAPANKPAAATGEEPAASPDSAAADKPGRRMPGRVPSGTRVLDENIHGRQSIPGRAKPGMREIEAQPGEGDARSASSYNRIDTLPRAWREELKSAPPEVVTCAEAGLLEAKAQHPEADEDELEFPANCKASMTWFAELNALPKPVQDCARAEWSAQAELARNTRDEKMIRQLLHNPAIPAKCRTLQARLRQIEEKSAGALEADKPEAEGSGAASSEQPPDDAIEAFRDCLAGAGSRPRSVPAECRDALHAYEQAVAR